MPFAFVVFLAISCQKNIGKEKENSAKATNTHVSEAMKKLDFLVGKWQGKVIRYGQDSDQNQEVVTSHIHYSVGGNILLIDEKVSEIGNRNNTKKEVFVVAHWDSAAEVYPVRLYYPSKGGARSDEAKGYLQDNKFVVLKDLPGSVRRYTISLNEKGQWHEVKDVSKDGGKTWNRRWEMTLNRQD